MTAVVAWREDGGELRPFILANDQVRVAWAPQPGSQTAFLACPVTEVLFCGSRGPGKTDALLMDFAQFVGRGFGRAWRGILFRKTYPELADVIEKSRAWYPRIFPGCRYNESKHEWRWPNGEALLFRHAEHVRDYDKYHGHSYAWIGWEELTGWASDELYKKMISVLRSSNPNVPRHLRSTTNPYGVGHNWVKARFELPVPHGRIAGPLIKSFDDKGKPNPDRIAIHGALSENLIMLHADPDYESRIRAAASNPQQAEAWLSGNWDIVAGGMFDDLWNPTVHVVPPIPLDKVPLSWRLDRAYDDGQSKPFSVGWWAQSSGEPIMWEGRQLGAVRGDLIRVQEWYGWNGQPNQGLRLASRDIAKGIRERQAAWGVEGRVRPGPADGSIWNADPKDPGASIALEMQKHGVSWEPADKRPGSRKQGWRAVRALLKGAIPGEEGRRELPGLFVSSACRHFLRTIPVLPRDEKDPDDVDTESEDHIADEMRYRVRRPRVVETRTPNAIY